VSAGGVVITDPFQHNLYSVSNPIETLQSEEDRFIGLPEYFSPEQAQGSRPDLRSDIYVIGLIIYKMLTGRTTFESGNPSIILKRQIHEQPLPPRLVKPGIEISSELEAIIQQALAKNPDERFDSPRAMRAAIAAVREDFDADSEMAATPLGPYPIDAEVPDADAESEQPDSGATEEKSADDEEAEQDGPVATAEFAAVEQAERRHMTETPVALGAIDDEVDPRDEEAEDDPIQFLDDEDDSPFEELDEPQADHSYDGTDDETLEAIEDFATLAAEFDYGFDDEQTNSWFAAGDDAEEMADRHGDELPPSPKESERRHNRAFFLLVPLALIATIAAVLVMSSNNGEEGTESESADQVAEAEQEESAEGTAVAETDAAGEDAQEGQAVAAAAGEDAASADASADAEGEVAEGDAESDPETDEQAEEEQQLAAEAAEEEAEAEAQAAEEREAQEEEEAQAAEEREERAAQQAREEEEEEAEQQVAAAEQRDSGGSESDAGSSTGGDSSAQAAAGGDSSGSGASEGSGEGTQVAEAEAADPEAEAEAQRQAEEEARRQAEEEERQRAEAERQAQRSREIAEEARSALSSGNLDQARRLFNEALTVDSSNTSAHAGLGDTYFRMNEYRRAIPHHQAAGQYRALGMDYFRLNEYPKALQAFERAAAQGDPNAE
jgi:hypothetical protein